MVAFLLMGLENSGMLLFIVKLWLIANVGVSAESKNCSAKNLKRWDCRLKLSGMVVHVTKERILLSDGVWRAVDNIPMVKIIEWQQVRLEKLGGRLFLILGFWDEGAGEAKVQVRHWIVSEVTTADGVVKTEVKVRQVVQRRTLRTEGPRVPEMESETKPEAKSDAKPEQKKYLTDKAEKIELRSSHGKIVWRVGRETGVID